MRTRIVLLVVSVWVLGAGCQSTLSNTASLPSAGVPELQITSPVNGFQTLEDAIMIAGYADTEFVTVNSISYTLEQPTFEIPTPLHSGMNTILIEAGNGYSTTSLTRIVERL